MIIVQDLINEGLVEELAPLNAQIQDLNTQIAILEEYIANLPPPEVHPVPSLYNTGYRGSLASGTMPAQITADNFIVQNQILTFPSVLVTGSNVIFRNCRLTYSGAWGIDAQNGGSILIEDCIIGPASGGTGSAFRGKGTFRRNNVSIANAGNGGIVLTDVSTIMDNWFHDSLSGTPTYTAIGGNTAGSIINNNTIS